MATTPNLHDFDRVVINYSAGKDSQATLLTVMELAVQQQYPFEKIVVSHQDLGEAEWELTHEMVKAHGAHFGLRVVISRYRNKAKQEMSLLEYVEKRGMWPSSDNRYCTSDFKRGPGGRVLVQMGKEIGRPCRILNVYGFRAQESTARAKRIVWGVNERFSSATREVIDWLPIHDWKVEQVWGAILKSGMTYHRAYALGMPRLSCVFCIFAPFEALVIAGMHNLTLLDKYCATEAKIGHKFRKEFSLADVREEVRRRLATPDKVPVPSMVLGEPPKALVADFTM